MPRGRRIISAMPGMPLFDANDPRIDSAAYTDAPRRRRKIDQRHEDHLQTRQPR
jgi:hypothetical protein